MDYRRHTAASDWVRRVICPSSLRSAEEEHLKAASRSCRCGGPPGGRNMRRAPRAKHGLTAVRIRKVTGGVFRPTPRILKQPPTWCNQAHMRDGDRTMLGKVCVVWAYIGARAVTARLLAEGDCDQCNRSAEVCCRSDQAGDGRSTVDWMSLSSQQEIRHLAHSEPLLAIGCARQPLPLRGRGAGNR